MIFDGNADNEFPDVDDYDWSDADIIRVANCVDLEFKLTPNTGWLKDMGSKMLIIENIEELRMPQFDIGKATFDSVSKFTFKF